MEAFNGLTEGHQLLELAMKLSERRTGKVIDL